MGLKRVEIARQEELVVHREPVDSGAAGVGEEGNVSTSETLSSITRVLVGPGSGSSPLPHPPARVPRPFQTPRYPPRR